MTPFGKRDTAPSIEDIAARAAKFWSITYPHLDSEAKRQVDLIRDSGYDVIFATIDFCEGFVCAHAAKTENKNIMLPFIPDNYESGIMLQVGANFALKKPHLTTAPLKELAQSLMKGMLQHKAAMVAEKMSSGNKAPDVSVHVISVNDLPDFLKRMFQ